MREVNIVTEAEWGTRASRFLKAELKRAGVGYDELAARLTDSGMAESKASVANKLSRGTFQAAFLLASLKAIGCASLRIEDV